MVFTTRRHQSLHVMMLEPGGAESADRMAFLNYCSYSWFSGRVTLRLAGCLANERIELLLRTQLS